MRAGAGKESGGLDIAYYLPIFGHFCRCLVIFVWSPLHWGRVSRFFRVRFRTLGILLGTAAFFFDRLWGQFSLKLGEPAKIGPGRSKNRASRGVARFFDWPDPIFDGLARFWVARPILGEITPKIGAKWV